MATVLTNTMEWTEEMSVGVPSLDEQHRTLFGLLNELNECLASGAPSIAVRNVLTKVLAYANEHFDFEENCMVLGCYPKLHEHQCEHRNLVRAARKRLEDFDRGVPGAAEEALTLLRRWVSRHIRVQDKEYTPFVSGIGLK